jgi:hypothetical protein
MQVGFETLESYSDVAHVRVSKISHVFGRLFGELFGCQHKDMSRPFSRHGETYRVCIACGAHRAFDAKQWNTSGPYYYKEARTTDLMRH